MLKLPWLKLYRVEGESMQPTFKPGDLLLGSALVTPKVGHPVVLKRQPLSIKRIKKLNAQGVWLEGDNSSQSSDSRQYGYVNDKDIESVIFMKLA